MRTSTCGYFATLFNHSALFSTSAERSRERVRKNSESAAANVPAASKVRKIMAIAYSTLMLAAGNVCVARHQAYRAMNPALMSSMNARLAGVGRGATAVAIRDSPITTIEGDSASVRLSSKKLNTPVSLWPRDGIAARRCYRRNSGRAGGPDAPALVLGAKVTVPVRPTAHPSSPIPEMATVT
jgi:hypothetical protein